MIDESFQIFVSSKAATSYKNGTSSVEFTLPPRLVPDDYHLKLSLSHFALPVSFYNVNRNNQTWTWQIEGSEPVTVTIPTGQYTANTLRVALQTLWTAGGGAAVTYSTALNRYTFTHPTTAFTFLVASSTCFELLGFTPQDHPSVLLSLTSDGFVNLSPVRMILVSIDRDTGNVNRTSPNVRNILCCVPVTAPFGGVILFMPPVRFAANLLTNVLESLSITLTDQDGVALDLNWCHWSAAITVDCERYVADELV